MKTVAIIQARMGSTRLPGKVLAEIAGKPLLAWLVNRVAAAPMIDQVVVATTTSASDDVLVNWLMDAGLVCYRGSEIDVLDRYYQCAKLHQADLIVRVTADDPLKDPAIIEKAIGFFDDAMPLVDYCSNTMKPTYPEGLDIEVFRYAALEKAKYEALLPSEREHVTPYIWKNPRLFSLKNFEYKIDLSSWRWTVDKPNDLAFVRTIFEHYQNNPLVSFEEIINYLELNPEVVKINSGAIRNEGYLKSVKGELCMRK